MLNFIRNPDVFHGRNKSSDFFEGWYFKLVSPSEDYPIALIPGIFYGKNKKDSHSFIQILNGMDLSYNYMHYDNLAFSSSSRALSIKIQENHFSLNGISINIDDSKCSIKGELIFSNIKKWPDSVINPGSMGFYNYLTFMQCYSQVCAMSLSIKGSLSINGKKIDFSDGIGYIEKNWGKAFPYSWIWVQSSHFKNSLASLSCSIGHIPFPISSFRGFLIGLYVNDDFYKFTTINRSKLNIKRHKDDVEIEVRNSEHSLLLTTQSNSKDFILCKGPRDNSMKPLVRECLNGTVNVCLKNRYSSVIFSDTGNFTGIEYGGKQAIILD